MWPISLWELRIFASLLVWSLKLDEISLGQEVASKFWPFILKEFILKKYLDLNVFIFEKLSWTAVKTLLRHTVKIPKYKIQ